MSGLKSFVGQRSSSKHKFAGKDIEIYKLSVGQVLEVQQLVKANEVPVDAIGVEAEKDSMAVLKKVIAFGAEGGADLTDAEFESLPLDELSKLSTAIMKFSGLGENQGK